jgi:hypothetical protein
MERCKYLVEQPSTWADERPTALDLVATGILAYESSNSEVRPKARDVPERRSVEWTVLALGEWMAAFLSRYDVKVAG